MKKTLATILIMLILPGCGKQIEETVPPSLYSLNSNYSFVNAAYDGFVVYKDSKALNIAKLHEFYTNSQNNINGYVTIVNYTIEGDPIVYEYHYQDGKYILFIDNTRDEFSNDRKIVEKEINGVEIIKDNNGHDFLQEKENNE